MPEIDRFGELKKQGFWPDVFANRSGSYTLKWHFSRDERWSQAIKNKKACAMAHMPDEG
jgi:hypothetical protein